MKGVDLASNVSPTLAAYLKANGYSFVILNVDNAASYSPEFSMVCVG